MVTAYALLSVILVSLISLLGAFTLAIKGPRLQTLLLALVSFAVGALFGDVFIHLLPEIYDGNPSLTKSLTILTGIMVFFVMEKFIRWRHCHIADDEKHNHIHPMAATNLIGDGLHNFTDGALIGATYLVSIPLGLTTTLAIALHEIPSEIGRFGVLLRSGMAGKQAVLFNFLSALTAILGTILSLAIGAHFAGYTAALVPITAGGFIYIAGSDLIPELHHETEVDSSILQLLAILAGIALMAALVLLEK